MPQFLIVDRNELLRTLKEAAQQITYNEQFFAEEQGVKFKPSETLIELNKYIYKIQFPDEVISPVPHSCPIAKAVEKGVTPLDAAK